jgi:8-oxo-dGTP pyrophosphatase MutT (NUDIX family)
LIFVESNSRLEIRKRFESALIKALECDLPYRERPPFDSGTPASVLILIGFDGEDQPALLITQRTEQVETHKGQMAFPGGMNEPGETDVEAALRETEEEVGIPRSRVRVLGKLPKLWTVTDFQVTPVVGILQGVIADTVIRTSTQEIAETVWVPLKTLHNPETYRQEWIERGEVRFPIHCYYIGPYRIWGATGSMIENLLTRLIRIENRL